MKNWKTTLFGAIAALGVYFQSLSDSTMKIIGQVLSAVGTAGMGYFAADHSNQQK